ncbi:MAG TPA: hypothetical protein PLI45_05050 [Candidatus Woesebacteria bacterium]|nr:hypothetical protein [Candidatus Woesebacteria bacterium]
MILVFLVTILQAPRPSRSVPVLMPASALPARITSPRLEFSGPTELNLMIFTGDSCAIPQPTP